MGAPHTHPQTQSTPIATDPGYNFPWAGLLILAAAVFVAVTSEFVPVGLLPDLARTFDVTESQVGLLVTIFAGAVVLSAAPLTAATRRVPRKVLVVAVLIVFALGNGLAAIAPSYEVLVIARVIGGIAHGLFWSVVGAYGSYLVPKHHIGRAVAITSGGGSAAFVLGVPLGTALGQAVGWRLTFAIIGVTILVIIALVVKYLPAITHGEQLRTGEISVAMRKDRSLVGVVFICTIVIALMIGH
ncbi:MAG: transporter, partial [Glaciihabitans sp.]|nr:transporter [Glaciihabitans sp.]